MTGKAGFDSVAPVLACNDVLATANWYADVLGFTIDSEFTGADWAMLWADGAQLFLSRRPDLAHAARGQEVLIACDDVDAVHARHQQRGANIVSPIETKPWELREYTVEDPNGYHLRFQSWVGARETR